LVAVALLPVVGLATSAEAGDGPGKGWKKVHVSFAPTGGEVTTLDVTCDSDTAPSMCIVAEKITNVTETGDLQGSALQANSLSGTTSGVLVWNASGTFSGTVKECGTGTFAYSGRTLMREGVTSRIEYVIGKGTGTGDLEGISGTIVDDGTALTGVLRCKRR
jgi:hypothetical protein